jgi:hypothetical protein
LQLRAEHAHPRGREEQDDNKAQSCRHETNVL